MGMDVEKHTTRGGSRAVHQQQETNFTAENAKERREKRRRLLS
jgi:hypothetical protein